MEERAEGAREGGTCVGGERCTLPQPPLYLGPETFGINDLNTSKTSKYLVFNQLAGVCGRMGSRSAGVPVRRRSGAGMFSV